MARDVWTSDRRAAAELRALGGEPTARREGYMVGGAGDLSRLIKVLYNDMVDGKAPVGESRFAWRGLTVTAHGGSLQFAHESEQLHVSTSSLPTDLADVARRIELMANPAELVTAMWERVVKSGQ